MSSEHNELYEFENFRLDVSERILRRDGDRIPLSEKAFDILCVLLRRANNLVSKDILLTEVWGDTIVEENNLDKNISLLRQVLGEREGKGKFIETVRGHGFRFVPAVRQPRDHGIEANDSAPVVSSEAGLISSFANRRLAIIALAAVAVSIAIVGGLYLFRSTDSASAPIKSLAVLPFRPLVAAERDEALELGMADTLISTLGSDGAISVRPLSSVRRYGSLEQDSLADGRELGVEAVLDGTIQTSRDRIRITARLVRVIDDKPLWTGQFDEKFTDIFTLQDAISERVAVALKIVPSITGKKRETESAEAYQLYMKGRFHVLKAIKTETETGVSYFQKAIEVDPGYALAYVGLADAYRGLTVGGELNSAEYMPKAEAAATKAVEIDDTLAEAHASLGHILFWYDWNWSAAEAEYKRALELNPRSPDALQFYAHLLSATGRHGEALERISLARAIDPVNLRVNAIEGMLLLYAGQTDEAISRLAKTLELDPNYRPANMFVSRAYTLKGMFGESIEATSRARESSPESSEPIAYSAYAFVRSGKISEGRDALAKIQDLSRSHYVPPYNIALAYNAVGDTEKAFDYLEKGLSDRDVRMVFLKVEPNWQNLHSDSRFVALLKRMNF